MKESQFLVSSFQFPELQPEAPVLGKENLETLFPNSFDPRRNS